MTKFFKKSKKTYFGPFSALFARIWAKMNFPGDKGSVSFQLTSYSNYSIDIKNQKKTNNCGIYSLMIRYLHFNESVQSMSLLQNFIKINS